MRLLLLGLLCGVAALPGCKTNDVAGGDKVNGDKVTVYNECVGEFRDCDGDSANGCETNTQLNSKNCGECGKVCDGTNGQASCEGSRCQIECAAGFANCNSPANDGCEVDLTVDARHCGSCDQVCATGATCVQGACKCPSGQNDVEGSCVPGVSIRNLPATAEGAWSAKGGGSFEVEVSGGAEPASVDVADTDCPFVVMATPAGTVAWTCDAPGECSVTLEVTDAVGQMAEGELAIRCTNQAPRFTSSAPTQGSENEPFVHELTCVDDDGDALTLSLGVEDTCAGTLTTTSNGVGSYAFTPGDALSDQSCVVHVDCTDQETTSQVATVAIAATADLPVLSGTIPEQAPLGKPLVVSGNCTDADGEQISIVLGATDTCGGAVVSTGAGDFTYTLLVTPADAGSSCTLAAACRAGLDTVELEGEVELPGFPSCAGGVTCQGESCCTSLRVPGGEFGKGATQAIPCSGTPTEGATCTPPANGQPAYTCMAGGGTETWACPKGRWVRFGPPDGGGGPEQIVRVRDFYLDKYEVTVARFRKFVGVYDAARAGLLSELAGGLGAAPQPEGAAWGSSDAALMPATATDLRVSLTPLSNTWTQNAGAKEGQPITGVTWQLAYAFCAWDGGYLPTSTEWEYAAAGGAYNRTFPWGDALPDAARLVAAQAAAQAVGGKPFGAARWGHADLGGNARELIQARNMRGGSWGDAYDSGAHFNYYTQAAAAGPQVGFRCARLAIASACTTCPSGETCGADGNCRPTCEGMTCGVDDGVACGICDADERCEKPDNQCQPACAGAACNGLPLGDACGGDAQCASQACVLALCAYCKPGAQQCSGNGLQTCNSNGVWGAAVACSNQACPDGNTACTGVCAPGAKRCSANGVQTCTAAGEWGTAVACVNQACPESEMACTGVCKPYATRCSGNGVQTCSDLGVWGTAVACVNQACVSGDTQCSGVCSPGAKRCSGEAVQTCSAAGAWGNAVACQAPTEACQSGACVAPLAPFQSCSGLASNCGPSSNESCCTTLAVTGGTFYRSYDAVTGGYMSQAYPATVSSFRLDKYEITVGRFRKFKAAWDGGWRPNTGAGKHVHLNGGLGLANSAAAGNESGWDTAWWTNIAPTDGNLAVNATYCAWTASAGASENRPMNCANWFELAAFCIWDGGFLPSEAEWNYAAAGGSEQRAYPWSNPATSKTIDCSYANLLNAGTYCVQPGIGGTNKVGSESPKGDGKYGHADLAGNVSELVLDRYVTPYVAACNDCAYLLESATQTPRRGGSFADSDVLVSGRTATLLTAGNRDMKAGARCARAP